MSVSSVEEIKRKYPHAANNITEEGLLRADKDTLETWEFEGEQCDSVIKAVGSHKCPKCGSVVWKIGETIIDFHFLFTHSMRVQVLGFGSSHHVECVGCGVKWRKKS